MSIKRNDDTLLYLYGPVFLRLCGETSVALRHLGSPCDTCVSSYDISTFYVPN